MLLSFPLPVYNTYCLFGTVMVYQKGDVRGQLGFELTFLDVTVKYINHYTEIPEKKIMNEQLSTVDNQ